MVNLDDLMQNNNGQTPNGGNNTPQQPMPNNQPPTTNNQNIPYPAPNQQPVINNHPESRGMAGQNILNPQQGQSQQPTGYVASQQQALNQTQQTIGQQQNVPQQQPVMNVNKPESVSTPNTQSQQAQMYPQKATPSAVNVNINTDKDTKPPRINGFFRGLTLLVFLVVGVLLLLEATGVMNISIGGIQGTYLYPIVMLLGTFVLFRYKGFFAKLIGIIFFLVFVGGMAAILTLGNLNKETKSPFEENISYSTSAQNIIDIDIYGFIGKYTISGNNHTELVKGSYYSDRNLVVYSGNNGDTGFFQLVEDNTWNVFQKTDSNMAISFSNGPLYNMFYVKNFIGYQDIDLTQLDWNKAKFHGGLGDIYLTMGDNVGKNNEIEIASLYSNITLNIPNGVGVDLYYKNLMGKAKLQDMEEIEDNHFQSSNFGSKPKRVKITINTVSSNLNLNWIQ